MLFVAVFVALPTPIIGSELLVTLEVALPGQASSSYISFDNSSCLYLCCPSAPFLVRGGFPSTNRNIERMVGA